MTFRKGITKRKILLQKGFLPSREGDSEIRSPCLPFSKGGHRGILKPSPLVGEGSMKEKSALKVSVCEVLEGIRLFCKKAGSRWPSQRPLLILWLHTVAACLGCGRDPSFAIRSLAICFSPGFSPRWSAFSDLSHASPANCSKFLGP